MTNSTEPVKRLSTLAQLVQMYGECKGISSTKQLAELIGVSERAIRKAKAELSFPGTDVPRNHSSAGTGTYVPPPGTIVPPEPEQEFRPEPRAPARNEYPSGITILEDSKHAARAGEIDGLNGSTEFWVDQLAGWIAGPMGTKRVDEARILIESAVRNGGADKVKSALMDLQADITAGKKISNMPKAFARYCVSVRPPAELPPKRQTMHEILEARKAQREATDVTH